MSEELAAITLTADDWQKLVVSLHAAKTFVARLAGGDFDPEHLNTFLVMAGTVVDTLETWENLIEELRPKTAAADRIARGDGP